MAKLKLKVKDPFEKRIKMDEKNKLEGEFGG